MLRPCALACCLVCACISTEGRSDFEAPEATPPTLTAPKKDSGPGLATATATLLEHERGPSPINFGPLLGDHQRTHEPSPGTYGVRLDARQHRFLTMERTLTRSIKGGATLTLDKDGQAHACWWGKIVSKSTTSRYASRDGENHATERQEEFRLGARGRFRIEPETKIAHVVFDHLDYRSCEPSPDSFDASEPLELHCVAVTADALPASALACRIEGTQIQPKAIAMVLADTPLLGAWDLRKDLAHRTPLELPPDTKPWLLLGSEPGLRIRHRDSRARDPLQVDLESHRVVAPEDPLTR